MTAPYEKWAWRASVINGDIPAAKLAPIQPMQYDPDLAGPALMHPEAAAAMSALLSAAYADGVTELKVKYSYRTLTKQWQKWADYQNGGNLAAYPGTSNHGWAVAVDFTGLTTRALTWLRNNAGRFKFVNDVPSENWHYTYQGGWVDMAYEDFKKGWKAYTQGAHEPTEDSDFSFGWHAARYASERPSPGAHAHDDYSKKGHDHAAAAHTHEVKGTTV